jgi:hypothetical protein
MSKRIKVNVGTLDSMGQRFVSAWHRLERGENAVSCPVAIAVMSPWTDLALTGDSIVARAKHDPL